MKRYFLFFFLFLFCIPLAFGSFTDEWGEYQDDASLRGFVSDESGNWAETGTFTTIADGADFQPLLIDLDNDDSVEIIGSDGNYLQIWDYSVSALALEDELNFGATQTVMMTAWEDYDADDFVEMVMIFGTNVSVVEYNGTSINMECSNVTGTAVTGIRCSTFAGVLACYWANDEGNVTEMNENCSTSQYNISASDVFSTQYGINNPPAMSDIDRDGNQEFIFHYDHDDDGDEGVAVIDQSSMALDTGFSADGVIEVVAGGAAFTYVAGLMAYNVDGAGDTEIVMTYYGTGGGANDQDSYIIAYSSDGSTLWSATPDDETGSDTTEISPPVIQDFLDNGDFQVCVISTQQTLNDHSKINCYDDDSGTVLFYNRTAVVAGADVVHGWTASSPIVAANMDSDDAFELITGGAIISLDTSDNSTSAVNLSTNAEDEIASYPALADVDGDNNLDVCGQRANQIYCALSDAENAVPTLYGNLTYGGYGSSPYGFGDTICVNTTLTYSAQELTNYNNDLDEDTERISADCQGNGTYTNGTYSLSNPTVDCTYGAAGTYSVTLYLQDAANPDDYSQANSPAFTVLVINGISGVSCNVGTADAVGQYSLPSTTSQATDNAFAQVFDPILGRSSETVKIKMFIGFLLLGIVIITAVQKGVKEAFPLTLITIAGIIIFTIMTLFPVYLMLLMIFVMSLALLLGKFIIGGRAGEGV